MDTVGFEVQCLPQSSGGYAVARLDSGTLDVAQLGSTPFAAAVSRGVPIQGIFISALIDEGKGLVARVDSPALLEGATI
eukprot:6307781-Prymnesium_polylepis.1